MKSFVLARDLISTHSQAAPNHRRSSRQVFLPPKTNHFQMMILCFVCNNKLAICFQTHNKCEWMSNFTSFSPVPSSRKRENTHTSSSVYYAYASSQAMSQESGEVSKNKQKKLPHGQSRTSQNIYRWDEMRCCCTQVWSLGRVVAGTPRSGCTLHALAINTLGEMMMMWCVCESIVSKLHRESLG